MLKLAEIIREGLRIKQAKKGEPRKVEVPQEKPKVEPELPTVPQPEKAAEPTPAETPAPSPTPALPVAPAAPPFPPPVEARAEVKEEVEVESIMTLIKQEIEALEFTVDEENKLCRIGNLATLEFKDFEGCNPVIAAARIKEAVKKTLLKKYEVKPDELEKKLDELKKKFRTFGTHCYIRTIKQKM